MALTRSLAIIQLFQRGFIPIFILLCVGCSGGNDIGIGGHERINYNDDINQFSLAALSYTSVASACGEQRDFLRLKDSLVRLLHLSQQKNDLTSAGEDIYNNLDSYISKGINQYRRQPYISCSEAKGYYSQLNEAITGLLDANSR
ncbi:hypothetical protein OAI75_01705 [Woeseiaceae bacterium]|nr:hypothetical protein [Woeseiaceae bacterium]